MRPFLWVRLPLSFQPSALSSNTDLLNKCKSVSSVVALSPRRNAVHGAGCRSAYRGQRLRRRLPLKVWWLFHTHVPHACYSPTLRCAEHEQKRKIRACSRSEQAVFSGSRSFRRLIIETLNGAVEAARTQRLPDRDRMLVPQHTGGALNVKRVSRPATQRRGIFVGNGYEGLPPQRSYGRARAPVHDQKCPLLSIRTKRLGR